MGCLFTATRHVTAVSCRPQQACPTVPVSGFSFLVYKMLIVRRCDHMLAVVSALSGVSIVSNEQDKLVLHLVTHVKEPLTDATG